MIAGLVNGGLTRTIHGQSTLRGLLPIESVTSAMEHAMPEFDAADGAHLRDEPNSAFSGSVAAPRRPNTAAVLAALAALEEEFKSVLNSRVPASD